MIRSVSVALLLFITSISAQQKQIEGELSTVDVDGLHKIKISHDVRSYSKPDISDFRIWDTNKNQVPYFVYAGGQKTQISNFSEFEIVSRANIPDTSSTYIFKNPNDKIQSTVLSIANYQGSKRYSLLGSNDQKQWFGLVNRQSLYGLKSNTSTSIYKVINFPLSSYRYLKIIFDDSNALPINLLKIGTATTKEIPSPLDEISTLTTNTSELIKEKKTRIHVVFNKPEIIHQVQFNVLEPKLYNRKVRMYTLKTREVKHQEEMYEQQIATATIHSDNTSFSVALFFEKEVYIEIENQDNPKLTISSLQFFQNPLYVAADLKQGEKYTISSGDITLKKPSYDISYFRNKISENLPETSIVSVNYLQDKDEVVKEERPFWQQPWFMWACIGIAALMIAYFASSLLKDLKQDHK